MRYVILFVVVCSILVVVECRYYGARRRRPVRWLAQPCKTVDLKTKITKDGPTKCPAFSKCTTLGRRNKNPNIQEYFCGRPWRRPTREEILKLRKLRKRILPFRRRLRRWRRRRRVRRPKPSKRIPYRRRYRRRRHFPPRRPHRRRKVQYCKIVDLRTKKVTPGKPCPEHRACTSLDWGNRDPTKKMYRCGRPLFRPGSKPCKIVDLKIKKTTQGEACKAPRVCKTPASRKTADNKLKYYCSFPPLPVRRHLHCRTVNKATKKSKVIYKCWRGAACDVLDTRNRDKTVDRYYCGRPKLPKRRRWRRRWGRSRWRRRRRRRRRGRWRRRRH